jgi:DNA-binding MarR family transcriptional regulator
MTAEPTTDELRAAADFRSDLQQFLKRTEEITRRAGLTQQRYQLLLMIKAAPGEQTTVTELAGRLHLAETTVVELVTRSADAGLVVRNRSTRDGRVMLISLTSEGEQRLLRAFAGLREERAALARAMLRLDAAAGATREQDA